MSRESLLRQLTAYEPHDRRERAMVERTLAFVTNYEDCFERSQTAGHITGSAWILDRAGKAALLTHHAKLNKWLQPGGHSDGCTDPLEVAMREAGEESGLTSLRALSPRIFDVDVHAIPARGQEPEHFHYDIRFLFEADRNEPLVLSDESHALAWVELGEIRDRNVDESVLRLVAKSVTGKPSPA